MLPVFLSVTFSQAQQPNTSSRQTISPEKQVLIKEYIAATGGREMIQKNLDAMFANLNSVMPKIIESSIEQDFRLTAAQKTEILKDMPELAARLTQKFKDGLNQEFDYAKLIEELNYPLLDKYFTEAELKDLAVFYKSSTGQKAIVLQPQIYTEAKTKLNVIIVPVIQKVVKAATESEIAERVKKAKQNR